MNKKWIIAGAVLLVLVFVAIETYSCVSQKYRSYYYGMFDYSLSDFNTHKKAFALIADKLCEAYVENESIPNITRISVYNNPKVLGRWELLFSDGKDVFTVYENSNEEEEACFMEIVSVLHSKARQGLASVSVDGQAVFFVTESPYFIVYDYSDSYYNLIKKDESLIINKLGKRWFEVLRIEP